MVEKILNFLEGVSLYIRVVAITVVIILLILRFRAEKKFRFIREEDRKTISNLSKEKEELREGILRKLELLAEREKEQEELLKTIFSRGEKEGTRREDLLNFLKYQVHQLEERFEERINERLLRIVQRIERIEEHIEKEKKT